MKKYERFAKRVLELAKEEDVSFGYDGQGCRKCPCCDDMVWFYQLQAPKEDAWQAVDTIRHALKNAAAVIAWHDEKRVEFDKETRVILEKLVALNEKHPAEFFELVIDRYKEVVSEEKVSE